MRLTKSSADHFLGVVFNEETHGELCFSPFGRPDTVMQSFKVKLPAAPGAGPLPTPFALARGGLQICHYANGMEVERGSKLASESPFTS